MHGCWSFAVRWRTAVLTTAALFYLVLFYHWWYLSDAAAAALTRHTFATSTSVGVGNTGLNNAGIVVSAPPVQAGGGFSKQQPPISMPLLKRVDDAMRSDAVLSAKTMAFVTLCTNVKTLPAVIVQSASLKRVGSRFGLVVLVTDALPQWGIAVLNALEIRTLRVESLPYNFIGAPTYARGKWTEAVAKLQMFSLVEFEKLVYLDADVLIQKSVDNLFLLSFGGSNNVMLYGMLDLHDCIKDPNFAKLNTGVLVFQPSSVFMSQLLEDYKLAPQMPKWMSDQDLIEYTFTGRTMFLPESSATMMVQCACGRKLSEHSLIHGAGFLNTDALALYGMQNQGTGTMECSTEQYKLWVDTYLEECKRLRKANKELYVKMRKVGFCKILPWPGKDDAWKRVKELENVKD